MPTLNISEGFSLADDFSDSKISPFVGTVVFGETVSSNSDPPPPIYVGAITDFYAGYAKVKPSWTRTFEPWPLGRDAIQISLTERVDTLQLQLSNIQWSRFLGYLRLQDHHGQKVKIWSGFLDIANEEANLAEMFEGEISQVNFVEQTLTISLKGNISYLDRSGLGRAYFIYCPFKFKGRQCGYTGPDTFCNKSRDDCDLKGNIQHFGGFDALLKIQGTRNIV
jgi:phage-related protein